MMTRILPWIPVALLLAAAVQDAPERPRPAFRFSPDLPEAPKRPYMGVRLTSAPDGRLDCEHVVPGGPSDRAGMKKGDRIVSLDGVPVPGEVGRTVAEFVGAIQEKGVGTEVRIGVKRGEEEVEIKLTLEDWPVAAAPVSDRPEIPEDPRGSVLQDALGKVGKEKEFASVIAQIARTTRLTLNPRPISPGTANPLRLTEVNTLLHRPLDADEVCSSMTDRLTAALWSDRRSVGDAIVEAARLLDLAAESPPPPPADPSEDLDEALGSLLEAMGEATKRRGAAFEAVPDDDRQRLFRLAPELLDDLGSDDLHAYLRSAMAVDLGEVHAAAAALITACDREWAISPPAERGSPEASDLFLGDIIKVETTPRGPVIVGGPGRTIYLGDAALIVDLGGDDLYLNNAGGSTEAIPISVVLDLGGDDVYRSTGDFVQGAARCGIGILIDRAGDDHYSARSFSQGLGLLGVGVLLDLGGRDRYDGEMATQGVGLFGTGLIIEGDGNDTCQAARFSQGVGFPKGFGAILDRSGADTYQAGGVIPDFREPEVATQSLSQGFGFGWRPYQTDVGASGGIGVILDEAGHDTYIGDYFAQGSSYWFALGVLRDRAGNDKYIARRYSQGAATHLTVGVLIDDAGDDRYMTSLGVSQGMGHDWALGLLVDRAGDDLYRSVDLCQGAGNDNGLGILCDLSGGDTYIARGRCHGHGNYLQARKAGSFGLLLDAGGGADRFVNGYENRLEYDDGALLTRETWGLFIDTEDEAR